MPPKKLIYVLLATGLSFLGADLAAARGKKSKRPKKPDKECVEKGGTWDKAKKKCKMPEAPKDPDPPADESGSAGDTDY